MAGSSGPRRPDTVNKKAFQAIILDLAMKIELRKHLQSQDIPNFKTEVKKDILENGDVTFYWSLLSCDWEDESETLLDLFLTIRGFSYASTWVEKYKTASAKTLQKSKGLRKSLITTKFSNTSTS